MLKSTKWGMALLEEGITSSIALVASVAILLKYQDGHGTALLTSPRFLHPCYVIKIFLNLDVIPL